MWVDGVERTYVKYVVVMNRNPTLHWNPDFLLQSVVVSVKDSRSRWSDAYWWLADGDVVNSS